VQDLRDFLSRIHIGQMPPLQDISGIGKTDPELLMAFEAGFLRRLQLRFDYRDAKGKESSRQVEPQAILILPPVWYLVAWDPMRSDFRHFRMDRISAPKAIEGTWFRPRHVPFEEDVCPFQAPG
jgi:predicted DNA-binding transcriptional regulator YafY